MFLQSHRAFDTVADYDPETGHFETFSRRIEPNRLAVQPSGAFDFIAGKLVLLYRLGDALYLDIDGRRLRLDTHVIEVRPVNGRRVFRVSSAGQPVAELAYDAPPLDRPLSTDRTPFIEEEHFDFGLFLHNVSRDASRQKRMYRNG